MPITFSGRFEPALRDERGDGPFDLVRPLHELKVDRQPVTVTEDVELLDNALVDVRQRVDVALHREGALQPALLSERAHGRVEFLQ